MIPHEGTREKINNENHVAKRDGRLEEFSLKKLSNSHQKMACSLNIDAPNINIQSIPKTLHFSSAPLSTEEMQRASELSLKSQGFHQVSSALRSDFIEKTKARKSKSSLMKICAQIATSSAKDSDLKRSNANVDGDTAMGKMLQFGSEASKELSLTIMINSKHSRAHKQGDIHIHDLDFLSIGTLTCCQIDIEQLFEHGFNTGHGFVRTPNSIRASAALTSIVLQANQNEQHGGQSVPALDYALAVSVRRSFAISIAENILKFINFNSDSEAKIEDIRELLSRYNIKLNSVSTDTLKDLQNEISKRFEVDVSMSQMENIVKQSIKDTRRECFQAMEALIHNLNTMHSRAGAQVPFTSVNLGTDTSPEGRLVIETFLEATMAGLGHGETPIFPISIFKVKEGINYSPNDPNYDLFKLAMRTSAKRLFPNFLFLDAPFNLQYYKVGDYKTEVASMGCRTRVVGSVFPESDGYVFQRGNLSYTTINLPRIGIKHGICLNQRKVGDWNGFFQELDDKVELVKNQLLERFEIQAEKTVSNFPFLMGQGLWFGSNKLKINDKLRDVIKHGSLGIGFIGLAECLVAMTGNHHGSSVESQKIGLKIIKHLRQKTDAFSREYNLNFVLIATPGEGLAGRFPPMDRDEFGEISDVNTRMYYTNSFHVPVYFKIGAFNKIDIEAPYHEFCNGGHITYVELDGDPSYNIDAFEAVVRQMKDAGVGYGSINHPVDRDPVCGYNGIIAGDICPSCGRKEENGSGFERLRRITGYLVGTLERWNDAKQAEEKDRVKHGISGCNDKR